VIEVSYAGCDPQGIVSPETIRGQLRPNTRLMACTQASNVTGGLQPIEAIGEIARKHGALVLVDAAQSLGHVPIDVQKLPIDLLAAPGHKGLLGPLGTGLLYIRPGIEEHLQPLRQGGTGTQSEDDRQPAALPERYESGNLNVPGLVGLGEGVAYLLSQGIEKLRRHEIELTGQLMSALGDIDGLRLPGPRGPEQRVGVVSVSYAGFDPQEVAAMLEATYRIQVRAGLHCAPRMHQALGTLEHGGTVRFSIGPFNTAADIDAAIQAVRELAESQLSI
jgi:selenocysteine lyase/cysteine desulfurase